MKTKLIIIFLLLTYTCNHIALARSADNDEPILISADTAELNDKTGISIYRGDVKMVQGTRILTGDIVTVYSVDDEVKKVNSVGQLATYQETTDDGDIVYSEAEEMIFYRDEEKVEMFRKGKVTQEDNTIRSDYILYMSEEGFIDTGTDQDRVNIVIQPDSKNNEKEKDATKQ